MHVINIDAINDAMHAMHVISIDPIHDALHFVIAQRSPTPHLANLAQRSCKLSQIVPKWGGGGAPPTTLILLRNQRPARALNACAADTPQEAVPGAFPGAFRGHQQKAEKDVFFEVVGEVCSCAVRGWRGGVSEIAARCVPRIAFASLPLYVPKG